jgi:O-antigen/teichoic acid export membrane protein
LSSDPRGPKVGSATPTEELEGTAIGVASIKQNTVWNLLGSALPMLIALPAVPFLVRQIGVEAFGVFTLIWALIGYFSIFDFGLGRALTHQVSTRVTGVERKLLPGLVRSGVLLMLATGVVGGTVLAWLADPLGSSWLNVSENLAPETIISLRLAALGIPLSTLTSGLKGVLEGFEDFRTSSILRTLLGVCNFGLPVLATILVRPSLSVMVLSLLLGRLIVLFAHLVAVNSRLSLMLVLRTRAMPRDKTLALLDFGAWLTVSNVISPLMVTADRFVISSLLGAGAVAYYTVPFDFITRLLVIPAALTSVLFPRFTLLLDRSAGDADALYRRSIVAVMLAMIPVCVAIVFGSRWGLELWLGEEFAERAWLLSAILGIGLLFNSLAQIPHAFVQAAGNVRATALLHLAEFVVYFPFLLFALKRFGVVGAACAWTVRVIVDYALLRGIALRHRRPANETTRFA